MGIQYCMYLHTILTSEYGMEIQYSLVNIRYGDTVFTSECTVWGYGIH